MFKKILKGIWGFVEILIVIYAIVMATFILARNKYGFTQVDKYTFVMVADETAKFIPEKKVGDLLIIKNQQSDIQEGDLIYYYFAFDEKYVVKSGKVKTIASDADTALYTLDDEDNNSVSSIKVIGKYVSTHEKIGGVLLFLQGRLGFLICVLLPLLIVFIYQIYQLVIVAKYEIVEEDERVVQPVVKQNVQNEQKDDVELL